MLCDHMAFFNLWMPINNYKVYILIYNCILDKMLN